MKKTKKMFYTGVLMATALVNVSCVVDEIVNELIADQCNEEWTVTVRPRVDALNAANVAYSSEPTIANCENVRTAQTNYLEALQDVRECVDDFNRSNYDIALSGLKASIDETDCSE